MRYLLLHTPDWLPSALESDLAREGVEVRAVRHPASEPATDRPTAVVLGPEALEHASDEDLDSIWRHGATPIGVGPTGERDIPANVMAERLSAHLPGDAGRRRMLVAIRTALRESAVRRQRALAERELAARASEVSELTDIGIKLSLEKDYQVLLDMILQYALRVTASDAGSLYLAETSEDGGRLLRFKLTQNASLPELDFEESTIPFDHTSIAGHVAIENEPLVIDDVYQLPDDVSYHFNPGFDAQHGYRTKSMLVIPMSNHLGEVIGVLQLINHKRQIDAPLSTADDVDRLVTDYAPRLADLARALASQAAVALENSQLYQEIEGLFDGFVRAAVTAIEQRDPVTSGHSSRVADMTVRLATVVSGLSAGPFRDVDLDRNQIRELRYASLLHDFGKVAVREQVLSKEKKLYTSDLALVRQRHAFLVRTAQWQFEKARANHVEKYGTEGYEQLLPALKSAQQQEFARLDRFLTTVLTANEPSVQPEAIGVELEEFADETFRTLEGDAQPMLSESELRHLRIAKGTLDERERKELEDHVRHTFEFLRHIPWTNELSGVPNIAYRHHEKLDGSGYPHGVPGTAIPVQTRMMTLADIFDALTALDRPYKPALGASVALDLMREDVDQGGLDADLFDIFVHTRIYEMPAAV
jgi:HD-GYP domain-containing protein (c-di-GMP phosphodiesterase class II)